MNPPPSHSRPRPAACTGPDGTVQRLARLLLAFCIALHGLSMSSQRTGGRLHYHLVQMTPAGVAGVEDPGDGHEHAPVHDEYEHDQAHEHARGSLADHGHAIDLRGVVHVAQADGAGSPNPHASPPRLPDLDGLPVQWAALLAPGRVARWPEAPALLIRSFDGPPLERPPSRRA